jgi:hypothetical protein
MLDGIYSGQFTFYNFQMIIPYPISYKSFPLTHSEIRNLFKMINQ